MLDTQKFGDSLKIFGYNFYSGVPCSFLKDLINYSINECDYVMAANEGDAVAICAGAYIAGRKAVALMQNSGLGNAVSPLTSLNAIFRIPVLGFVSLRGEPELGDEPQHELMGVITGDLLTAMKINWEYLSGEQSEAETQIARADENIMLGKSFFFIVKKATFSKVPLEADKKSTAPQNLPDRSSLIAIVRNLASKQTILAATTGFTGRELYKIGDDERNFYMVGSLGCLSSFCLGISLVKPDRPIIVLDGDGSLLMRTGALPTIAAYKPTHFLHILMDNRAHESTGGQFTVSGNVAWTALALAVGYPTAISVNSANELAIVVRNWEISGGLVFVHAQIRQGAPKDLGRPKIKPFEVAERLAIFLRKDRREI